MQLITILIIREAWTRPSLQTASADGLSEYTWTNDVHINSATRKQMTGATE